MSVFPQVKGAIAAGFLPQALADAVDQGVAAFDAQIRDLAASSDRIALADVDVLVNSIFAPAQFQVGGVTIDRDLPSDNPSSLWLADGLHAGTVAQGLLANVFIDAMDDEFHAHIKPLSSNEILHNAGLPPGAGGGFCDRHIGDARHGDWKHCADDLFDDSSRDVN